MTMVPWPEITWIYSSVGSWFSGTLAPGCISSLPKKAFVPCASKRTLDLPFGEVLSGAAAKARTSAGGACAAGVAAQAMPSGHGVGHGAQAGCAAGEAQAAARLSVMAARALMVGPCYHDPLRCRA